MYCQTCGKYNQDNAKFCVGCGAGLSQSSSTAQQSLQGTQVGNQYGQPQIIYVQATPEKTTSSIGNYFSRHRPNIGGIIVSIVMFITAFQTIVSEKYIHYELRSIKFSDTNMGAFIILIAIASIVLAVLGRSGFLMISSGLGFVNVYLTFSFFDENIRWRHGMNNIELSGPGVWLLVICSAAYLIVGIYGIVSYSHNYQYYSSEESSSNNEYLEKLKNDKFAKPVTGSWKCSNCGTVNPNYTGTCKCGNNKTTQNSTVVRKPITPSQTSIQNTSRNAVMNKLAQNVRCPICGASVASDRTSCLACGEKIIK